MKNKESTSRLHRTPRVRLGWIPGTTGAGSVSRIVSCIIRHESIEMDIDSIRSLCGLDSGVGLFGPNCGTGPRRSRQRYLLSYHYDVPPGAWWTFVRYPRIASGKTAQAADPLLHAHDSLVDSIVTCAGGG